MHKKLLTAIVTAALLATLAATPASAELFPRVPTDFTTTDGGVNVGGSENAPAGWQPSPPLNTEPQVGDEERILFDTDSLETTFGTVGTQAMPHGRLTGLAYNLQVVEKVASAGGFTLYYGQSDRNPLTGTPAGAGGRFELYEDSDIGTAEDTEAEYFDHDSDGLAPFDWVEGGGPSGGDDQFPGVNAEAVDSGRGLWLQGYFAQLGTINGKPYVGRESVDLASNTTTVFQRTVVATGGRADTAGYFNAPLTISGSSDGPSNGTYDGNPVDDGNWQTSFDDPWDVQIAVGVNTISIGGQIFTVDADTTDTMHLSAVSSLYAPEPGMASLLGIGLLGLLLTGRRRKSD